MDCIRYKVVSIKSNRLTYRCHGFQYDMFKFPLKLPQHGGHMLNIISAMDKEIIFPSYLT